MDCCRSAECGAIWRIPEFLEFKFYHGMTKLSFQRRVCVLVGEMVFYGACGGEKEFNFTLRVTTTLTCHENSRKDGPSLSSDDEDEEEMIGEEITFFPFSLLGFLEKSRGSMTHS
ncbi:hypothetical protein Tco_0581274 [Tanacetum coccineum]